MPPVAAAVGLTVGEAILGGALIGTAVASNVQSNKARHAQERANKAQARIGERQAQRQRIQALREARIQQASVQQAGIVQGAESSSAVQGGVSSIGSQMAGNISFINQIQGLQQQIQMEQQRASSAAGKSQAFANLGSLALSSYSIFGKGGGTTPPADSTANMSPVSPKPMPWEK